MHKTGRYDDNSHRYWEENMNIDETTETCWYYLEGKRCPFSTKKWGCRYYCYAENYKPSSIWSRSKQNTFDNKPRYRREQKDYQEEENKELGTVKQQLNFLEGKMDTLINSMTWAQRLQGGEFQRKGVEGMSQMQQMHGLPIPEYGMPMEKRY